MCPDFCIDLQDLFTSNFWSICVWQILLKIGLDCISLKIIGQKVNKTCYSVMAKRDRWSSGAANIAKPQWLPCCRCCGCLETQVQWSIGGRAIVPRFWYFYTLPWAGISGGSSGSMEPLNFGESCNETTRFLRFGAIEPVNFLVCQCWKHLIQLIALALLKSISIQKS